MQSLRDVPFNSYSQHGSCDDERPSEVWGHSRCYVRDINLLEKRQKIPEEQPFPKISALAGACLACSSRSGALLRAHVTAATSSPRIQDALTCL